MKLALTLRAAFIDTTQLPVPVHAPPHPLNAYPLPAAAVSVTDVDEANDALHVLPQLIPAGFDCTCPAPLTTIVNAFVADAPVLPLLDPPVLLLDPPVLLLDPPALVPPDAPPPQAATRTTAAANDERTNSLRSELISTP
jgi:hypothetical protein